MTRELHSEMRDWLDHKCAEPAHRALIEADARACFLFAMRAMVGIRESGGNNRGRLVELIQETLGKAEGEPWCMSAVQTALAWAELRTGKKSPIAASEHCMSVWLTTPKEQRVQAIPLPGAIIIWNKIGTSSGHTGIVLEILSGEKSEYMLTIEGNTESGFNAVGKVERDGGGCYQVERHRRQTGNMKVVGFLKPF